MDVGDWAALLARDREFYRYCVRQLLVRRGFLEAATNDDDAVELRRSGSNVAKAGGTFHVQETLCSRWTVLGQVKSDDGLRDVPLGATTSDGIRAWRAVRGRSPGERHGTPHHLPELTSAHGPQMDLSI